jgi:hypothetical protein
MWVSVNLRTDTKKIYIFEGDRTICSRRVNDSRLYNPHNGGGGNIT